MRLVSSILLLILTLNCFNLLAQSNQNYSFQKGEMMSAKFFEAKPLQTEDGYIVFGHMRVKNKLNFAYYLFSEDLKITKQYLFPMKFGNVKIKYHGIRKIFDKYYLFYTEKDRKNRQIRLLCKEFNIETKQLAPDSKRLGEYTTRGVKFSTFSFKLIIDCDSQHVMITSQAHESKYKALLIPYNFYSTPNKVVFNKNMDVIFSNSQIDLTTNHSKGENGGYDVQGFKINQNNDLIILGMSPDKKKKPKKKKPIEPRKIALFIFPNDAKRYVSPIELPDKYITSTTLISSGDQTLIIGGYLSDSIQYGLNKSQGLFSKRVHVNHGLISSSEFKLQPFSIDFIYSFNGYKNPKFTDAKKNKMVSKGRDYIDAVFTHAYSYKDELFIFYEHQNLRIEQGSNSSGSTYSYDIYGYGNVGIFQIDQSLESMEKTIIYKGAYSVDKYVPRGYAFSVNDDDELLLMSGTKLINFNPNDLTRTSFIVKQLEPKYRNHRKSTVICTEDFSGNKIVSIKSVKPAAVGPYRPQLVLITLN